MSLDLIKRDLTLALRSGGAWLLGLLFFALFMTFCVIAVGGQRERLAELAPALIWLATLFSALISFSGVFSQDMQDGTLEQLMLSPLSAITISLSKMISFSLLSIAPLFLAVPLFGVMLSMPPQSVAGTALSVLAAMPAIAAYGTLASALMARRGSGGFLIILISAPFLLPLLIFGLSAAESYAQRGLLAFEFRALIGLSLIACAIAIPAAAAALKTNLE